MIALELADLAAHRVIVEGLRDLDSAIPMLSEESTKPTSCIVVLETLWVVDPMDGTRNYQADLSSPSHCLGRSGGPHLGLVCPSQKLLLGRGGMGAFKQAEGGAVERIQTRKPMGALTS